MSELSPPTLLAVIGAIGAGTLLLRASFLVGMGERSVQPWMRRVLRPVPAAVLSALVVPAVVLPQGEGLAGFDPASPRLWAGLLAAVVAWRTRNAFLTIGSGMLVLWGLQALG